MTCLVILVKSARNDLPLTTGLQWPRPPRSGPYCCFTGQTCAEASRCCKYFIQSQPTVVAPEVSIQILSRSKHVGIRSTCEHGYRLLYFKTHFAHRFFSKRQSKQQRPISISLSNFSAVRTVHIPVPNAYPSLPDLRNDSFLALGRTTGV